MDLIDLTRATLRNDFLSARQWVADAVREGFIWSDVAMPAGAVHPNEIVVSAAIVELMAGRAGVSPPAWTGGIGAAVEPVYLSQEAQSVPRFRQLLEKVSPEPLRRRNVFAMDQFLTIA